MAYSSAEISADDLALRAADKPFMAGITSMSASTGKWVASSTGTWATADNTDASYPFRNCYDGLTNVQTRPATPGADMAMLFDFGAAGIEFDTLAFFNHTFYSDTCTNLTVQIADDNAYSVNPVTIYTANPSTLLTGDNRFTAQALYHTGTVARRYSTVRWVRVQLTFAGAIPRIGELAFCRRRQWKWQPNNDGWDPDAMTGDVKRAVSGSGVKRDTVLHYGARTLSATWIPNTTAMHTDILAFWSDTSYGGRPFVYIDTPASAANDVHLMVFDQPSVFSMPFVNWQARSFTLQATEQGPHFLAVVST